MALTLSQAGSFYRHRSVIIAELIRFLPVDIVRGGVNPLKYIKIRLWHGACIV